MLKIPIARQVCLAGLLMTLLLAACQAAPDPTGNLPDSTATHTAAPAASTTATASRTPTPTRTPTASQTATVTATATPSLSPTASDTPTITPTATFDFPDFTVGMQANCRYGPGTAYLYAAGLYAGDRAEIRGRNYSGTWLLLRPETIDYFCWAAASVGEIQGDINTVRVSQPLLPRTTFIGPPTGVQAVRQGSQVTVSWNPVNVRPPEDSRGYLIEATLCQNGLPVGVAVHTEGTNFTFDDEPGCGSSGGLLYAVEKHGYTDPVPIPWPE